MTNVTKTKTDTGFLFTDFHGNFVLTAVRDDDSDGWRINPPGEVRNISSLAYTLSNDVLVLSVATAEALASAIQHELEAMGY